MAFPNVKRILRMGSAFTSYKLILAVGTSSRPKYRDLLLTFLKPFVRDGEFSIRYRCYGRSYKTFIRLADLSADVLSTRELGVNDAYSLDRDFQPDFVVDGGGNIGLFTLRAAACVAPAANRPPAFLICEPLPRNIAQIQRHLRTNGVQAEILPVCLGGTPRNLSFYCRGANESSFDSALPYDGVLDIPVALLADIIPPSAQRILIKLDIEGMEIETLAAYLPVEQRPVYIVGELHDYPTNRPVLERLFRENGWLFELFDVDQLTCSFKACSRPAAPLLTWAKQTATLSRNDFRVTQGNQEADLTAPQRVANPPEKVHS